MSDFENLCVGNTIKINVGSKYLTLRANGYNSGPDIVLEYTNWSDYYLELLNVDQSSCYSLFALFDQNDYRLYDIEVSKYLYNQWMSDYFIFKVFLHDKGKSRDNSPIICTCESRDLLWYGCRCGAFKRENKAKDDKNNLIDINDDDEFYF